MLLCAATGAAQAANLDKTQCEALKAEEAQLVTAGVKTDMDKGPEWAKANLAPERIAQIKQLINVGEQIAFRCEPLHPPVEAKLPGVPPTQGKSRKAGAGAQAAATDAEADGDDASPGITSGHLPPPDAGEPPKKKAAKRASKRKTAAGSAGKGKSAAKAE